MHILDSDYVALEVKYHKCCYERYTSSLRHANPQDEENKHEVNNYKYRKSFESFCVFVQHELIENENIYYMTRLKNEFDESEGHRERRRVQFQNMPFKKEVGHPQSQLFPPVGNGWRLSDGQLEIVWMTRPSAPDSLREYVDCKCKTGCGTQRCSCLKAGLKCTECCRCANCQNNHDENTNAKEISDGELSDADSSDSVCESDYELFEE
jgi:hypothetical protein